MEKTESASLGKNGFLIQYRREIRQSSFQDASAVNKDLVRLVESSQV